MVFNCSEILSSFEYDSEKGCWIHTENGRAYQLLDKDQNDMVRAVEICDTHSHGVHE